MPERDWQGELEAIVDAYFLLLQESSAAGVELDLMTTFMQRLQAEEFDLNELPLPLRMMLG